MSVPYDKYDYPSYWKSRSYENKAEIFALNSFLTITGNVKKAIDIGAGYGRLTPTYLKYCSKVVLSDPSSKLLKVAKTKLPQKNIQFIRSTLENLTQKVKPNSFDLILLIRVLHHITDIDQALSIIKILIKNNGYLILEFANKSHLKETLKEFLKGNFTYPLEIFPIDRRSKRNIKNKSIAFTNYHPDVIIEKVKSSGFEINEVRSVSNFRSRRVKKLIPEKTLLKFETKLQLPLARFFFGPSIFILAQYKCL